MRTLRVLDRQQLSRQVAQGNPEPVSVTGSRYRSNGSEGGRGTRGLKTTHSVQVSSRRTLSLINLTWLGLILY